MNRLTSALIMTAIPCSLSNLFKLHDEDHRNYLTPNQLCSMYDTIRVGGISIAQVSEIINFLKLMK